MITYEDQHNGTVVVYVDGDKTGEIREHTQGFRYYPRGDCFRGNLYPTLAAVKRSLESEE